MIPVQCRIPHRPSEGKYGDCVRACIASVLEVDAEQVPHFYEDNCSPVEGMDRIRRFLRQHKCTVFISTYAGSTQTEQIDCPHCNQFHYVTKPETTLSDVLNHMSELNPDAMYLLFGNTGEGDHVVVCEGGKVVHNPAWTGCSLVAPTSSGFWQVLVIARR